MAAILSQHASPVTRPAATTATNDAQKGRGRQGNARLVVYLVRLGYAAAAVLALALLVLWASPAAKTLGVEADGAVEAFVAAPYVSSDPSLPSAASVFQGQPSEAVQQVDSF